MITAAVLSETPEQITLRVVVKEDGGETRHEVALARKDLARLGRSGESPDAFVVRCFGFLLEREPKESIMSRFEVRVIARYFPEFERTITGAP